MTNTLAVESADCMTWSRHLTFVSKEGCQTLTSLMSGNAREKEGLDVSRLSPACSEAGNDELLQGHLWAWI